MVTFELGQSDSSKGETTGSVVAGQDVFFTPLPVANARQFVTYSKNHFQD